MSTAKVKRVLWSAAMPLAGFGVGWAGYNYIDQHGLLGRDFQQKVTINNLKVQRYVQRFLPESVVEKYGYPERVLNEIIEQMQNGYADMNDRMTFEQVLKECDEEEQIGFLEEHASEEIPYFYIADVFNAWAQLHKDALVGKAVSAASRKDRRYESPLLCTRVWETLITDVIPYDVSATCLAILAQKNANNAKQLATLVDVNVLLEKYQAYINSAASTGGSAHADSSASSCEFSPEEVSGATLLLLKTLNDASVHRRLVPGLGKPSTGPFPLVSRVTPVAWCTAFPSVTSVAESTTTVGALNFLEAVEERLKCQDRQRSRDDVESS